MARPATKPQELGVGDIVIATHRTTWGTGIVVDTDTNRINPLHVLFDDDYDDWFHPLELTAVAPEPKPDRPVLKR